MTNTVEKIYDFRKHADELVPDKEKAMKPSLYYSKVHKCKILRVV